MVNPFKRGSIFIRPIIINFGSTIITELNWIVEVKGINTKGIK